MIESEGNRLIFIGCGSVEPPDNLPLASRLLAIHEGLAAVLGDFRPMEAAVEQTFVNKDGVATLKLGQARGVAMLAPAMFGIAVAEYAPNQVKKTVVGAGHADKNQVAVMLKILLPKAEPKSADAADALAIAITHAHHRQGAALRLKVAGPMIGKLKGLIDSYGEDYVILDVGGVGYQVHCSARTLQALPSPGEAAVLSIETYVREDQIKLFGFRSDVEREWFRLLQTVQGVGAKVALAVLGTLPPAELANAIALRDKAAVARTPGVGPKVAERIVTELKDKAPALRQCRSRRWSASPARSTRHRAPRPVTDAISALVNLGYGQPQAAAAIAAAARSAGETRGDRATDPARPEGTGEVDYRHREGSRRPTKECSVRHAEQSRPGTDRRRHRGHQRALSQRLAGGRRCDADPRRPHHHRREYRRLYRPHRRLRGGDRDRPRHHRDTAITASRPSSPCGTRSRASPARSRWSRPAASAAS